MKRFFIGLGIAGFLIVELVIGFVVVPVMEYARPKWPKIQDPAKFVQDCRAVVTSHPTGELKKEDWPDSIRAISPLQVIVAKNEFLELIISTGGIGPNFSYMVFASEEMSHVFTMSDVTLHRTSTAGVYKLY